MRSDRRITTIEDVGDEEGNLAVDLTTEFVTRPSENVVVTDLINGLQLDRTPIGSGTTSSR